MSIEIRHPSIGGESGPRNPWQAMARGAAGLCPACGHGRMYGRFLKVRHACDTCGTELHHHRADDAPPYFTMLIVGHIVVGGVLSLERLMAPSMLVHLMLWIPLTLGLSLWLLPMVKGALVALQWALRMHGFGKGADPAAPEPLPAPGETRRGS